MALVNALSIQIQDYAGDVKTMPVYVNADMSLATIATSIEALATEVDAAIDGQVIGASVQLQLDISGSTIKGAPTAGNTVHEGALLQFSAEDTGYAYSVYVPSWENGGFAGNVVLDTGVYGTLIGDLENYKDRYGNNLLSFVAGRRAFRK